ncbi:retention module-containing protein [Campylobacter pinnipediorum]|uniref:retention module-containing protein n=1 Tax=Campylobacter pinnipediorum TaxID=1965231 RepID=UPI00084D12A6|nr:retention module-containing protein [Campylobacter pinnipediorum]
MATSGIIIQLVGNVVAIDATGKERVVQVGDEVVLGEVIKTIGESSKVTISTNDDKDITLLGNDTLSFDNSVTQVQSFGDDAIADANSLQQAILSGADLTQLEETAAGGDSAAGDGGEGTGQLNDSVFAQGGHESNVHADYGDLGNIAKVAALNNINGVDGGRSTNTDNTPPVVNISSITSIDTATNADGKPNVLKIIGTSDTPNSVVVFKDSDGKEIGRGKTDNEGNFDSTIGFTDGPITAEITDLSGNIGSDTDSTNSDIVFTDKTPPEAPRIEFVEDTQDTQKGILNIEENKDSKLTTIVKIHIPETVEVGDTLEYKIDNETTKVKITNENKQSGITVEVAISDGQKISVTAKIIDQANNESKVVEDSLIIDLKAPDVTIEQVAGKDFNSNTPTVTNDTTPSIKVKVEKGSTPKLVDDKGQEIPSDVVDNNDGTFTLTPKSPVDPNDVNVLTTDEAGNTTKTKVPLSFDINVTIEETNPAKEGAKSATYTVSTPDITEKTTLTVTFGEGDHVVTKDVVVEPNKKVTIELTEAEIDKLKPDDLYNEANDSIKVAVAEKTPTKGVTFKGDKSTVTMIDDVDTTKFEFEVTTKTVITYDNYTNVAGVTVTAEKVDGTTGNIVKVEQAEQNGIGVEGDTSGTADTRELGTGEDGKSSEKIIVKLDGEAESVTIRTSWLHQGEKGHIKFLDRNGHVVGESEIKGDNDKIGEDRDFAPNSGLKFSTIEFTAEGFDSDYLLNKISLNNFVMDSDVNTSGKDISNGREIEIKFDLDPKNPSEVDDTTFKNTTVDLTINGKEYKNVNINPDGTATLTVKQSEASNLLDNHGNFKVDVKIDKINGNFEKLEFDLATDGNTSINPNDSKVIPAPTITFLEDKDNNNYLNKEENSDNSADTPVRISIPEGSKVGDILRTYENGKESETKITQKMIDDKYHDITVLVNDGQKTDVSAYVIDSKTGSAGKQATASIDVDLTGPKAPEIISVDGTEVGTAISNHRPSITVKVEPGSTPKLVDDNGNEIATMTPIINPNKTVTLTPVNPIYDPNNVNVVAIDKAGNRSEQKEVPLLFNIELSLSTNSAQEGTEVVYNINAKGLIEKTSVKFTFGKGEQTISKIVELDPNNPESLKITLSVEDVNKIKPDNFYNDIVDSIQVTAEKVNDKGMEIILDKDVIVIIDDQDTLVAKLTSEVITKPVEITSDNYNSVQGIKVTSEGGNGHVAISSKSGHSGLGITGNTGASGDDIEIGHIGTGSESEKLVFTLDGEATSVDVKFDWLASNESGLVEFYDKDGKLIETSEIKPGNDNLTEPRTFAPENGEAFSIIKFSTSGEDSDYLVNSIKINNFNNKTRPEDANKFADDTYEIKLKVDLEPEDGSVVTDKTIKESTKVTIRVYNGDNTKDYDIAPNKEGLLELKLKPSDLGGVDEDDMLNIRTEIISVTDDNFETKPIINKEHGSLVEEKIELITAAPIVSVVIDQNSNNISEGQEGGLNYFVVLNKPFDADKELKVSFDIGDKHAISKTITVKAGEVIADLSITAKDLDSIRPDDFYKQGNTNIIVEDVSVVESGDKKQHLKIIETNSSNANITDDNDALKATITGKIEVKETIITVKNVDSLPGISITAIKDDGKTSGKISKVTDERHPGFGVEGQTRVGQNNEQYNADDNELGRSQTGSEAILVKFQGKVDSADVKFAWLAPNEKAKVELLDDKGNVVGTQIINGKTDSVDSVTIKTEDGKKFSAMKFTAPELDKNGTGNDYLINEIKVNNFVIDKNAKIATEYLEKKYVVKLEVELKPADGSKVTDGAIKDGTKVTVDVNGKEITSDNIVNENGKFIAKIDYPVTVADVDDNGNLKIDAKVISINNPDGIEFETPVIGTKDHNQANWEGGKPNVAIVNNNYEVSITPNESVTEGTLTYTLTTARPVDKNTTFNVKFVNGDKEVFRDVVVGQGSNKAEIQLDDSEVNKIAPDDFYKQGERNVSVTVEAADGRNVELKTDTIKVLDDTDALKATITGNIEVHDTVITVENVDSFPGISITAQHPNGSKANISKVTNMDHPGFGVEGQTRVGKYNEQYNADDNELGRSPEGSEAIIVKFEGAVDSVDVKLAWLGKSNDGKDIEQAQVELLDKNGKTIKTVIIDGNSDKVDSHKIQTENGAKFSGMRFTAPEPGKGTGNDYLINEIKVNNFVINKDAAISTEYLKEKYTAKLEVELKAADGSKVTDESIKDGTTVTVTVNGNEITSGKIVKENGKFVAKIEYPVKSEDIDEKGNLKIDAKVISINNPHGEQFETPVIGIKDNMQSIWLGGKDNVANVKQGVEITAENDHINEAGTETYTLNFNNPLEDNSKVKVEFSSNGKKYSKEITVSESDLLDDKTTLKFRLTNEDLKELRADDYYKQGKQNLVIDKVFIAKDGFNYKEVDGIKKSTVVIDDDSDAVNVTLQGIITKSTSITVDTVTETDKKVEGVTLTAKGPYGESASISTVKNTEHDGFGVEGDTSRDYEKTHADGRADSKELGYLADTGSEKIILKLDNQADSIQVKFAWKNSKESAKIEFYREDKLVGTQTIEGENSNDRVDETRILRPQGVNNNTFFDKVVFSAPNKGDDYLINEIRVNTITINKDTNITKEIIKENGDDVILTVKTSVPPQAGYPATAVIDLGNNLTKEVALDEKGEGIVKVKLSEIKQNDGSNQFSINAKVIEIKGGNFEAVNVENAKWNETKHMADSENNKEESSVEKETNDKVTPPSKKENDIKDNSSDSKKDTQNDNDSTQKEIEVDNSHKGLSGEVYLYKYYFTGNNDAYEVHGVKDGVRATKDYTKYGNLTNIDMITNAEYHLSGVSSSYEVKPNFTFKLDKLEAMHGNKPNTLPRYNYQDSLKAGLEKQSNIHDIVENNDPTLDYGRDTIFKFTGKLLASDGANKMFVDFGQAYNAAIIKIDGKVVGRYVSKGKENYEFDVDLGSKGEHNIEVIISQSGMNRYSTTPVKVGFIAPDKTHVPLGEEHTGLNIKVYNDDFKIPDGAHYDADTNSYVYGSSEATQLSEIQPNKNTTGEQGHSSNNTESPNGSNETTKPTKDVEEIVKTEAIGGNEDTIETTKPEVSAQPKVNVSVDAHYYDHVIDVSNYKDYINNSNARGVERVQSSRFGRTLHRMNAEAELSDVTADPRHPGFGVATADPFIRSTQGGDTNEIGHYTYNNGGTYRSNRFVYNDNGSETLTVNLKGLTDQVDVKFAWKSKEEQAKVEFLKDGKVVDTWIVEDDLSNDEVDPARTLSPGEGILFDAVRFSAPREQDDYLINEIKYNVSDRDNYTKQKAFASFDISVDNKNVDKVVVEVGNSKEQKTVYLEDGKGVLSLKSSEVIENGDSNIKIVELHNKNGETITDFNTVNHIDIPTSVQPRMALYNGSENDYEQIDIEILDDIQKSDFKSFATTNTLLSNVDDGSVDLSKLDSIKNDDKPIKPIIDEVKSIHVGLDDDKNSLDTVLPETKEVQDLKAEVSEISPASDLTPEQKVENLLSNKTQKTISTAHSDTDVGGVDNVQPLQEVNSADEFVNKH